MPYVYNCLRQNRAIYSRGFEFDLAKIQSAYQSGVSNTTASRFNTKDITNPVSSIEVDIYDKKSIRVATAHLKYNAHETERNWARDKKMVMDVIYQPLRKTSHDHTNEKNKLVEMFANANGFNKNELDVQNAESLGRDPNKPLLRSTKVSAKKGFAVIIGLERSSALNKKTY